MDPEVRNQQKTQAVEATRGFELKELSPTQGTFSGNTACWQTRPAFRIPPVAHTFT